MAGEWTRSLFHDYNKGSGELTLNPCFIQDLTDPQMSVKQSNGMVYLLY